MRQGATRLPSAAKIVDLAQEVLRILCNPFDRFSGSHAGSVPKKQDRKYLRNQSQTQRNYMVNYMVSRVLRIQTGAGSGNSLMSSELHS